MKNNSPEIFNSLPEALTRVEYYGMVVKGKANENEISESQKNSDDCVIDIKPSLGNLPNSIAEKRIDQKAQTASNLATNRADSRGCIVS